MATSTEIEELRGLLDVVERRTFDQLEQRIRTLEQELERFTHDKQFRTDVVADVLPLAVHQRGEADRAFTKSVQPHVVESIGLSSRNEPDAMAAALYPVLGPAIRKMVASYFTLDRSSKTSFTPEHVFLIVPDSGLVVQHVTTDVSDTSASDVSGEADVISGMLEAIRSFVQDSFDVDNHDGMRELAVGDITVMVEWGPAAIVACVVRGIGSDDYRTAIQQTLQNIHGSFAEELANYDGDPESMAALQPTLESLLDNELAAHRSKPADSSNPNMVWVIIVIFVSLCLILFLIGN